MLIARRRLFVAVLLASTLVAGCKSDEEKMLDRQDRMMSPAAQDADAMMREGQQMKDKGMTMKNNGQASDGEKMIRDGEVLIAKSKKAKEAAMKE